LVWTAEKKESLRVDPSAAPQDDKLSPGLSIYGLRQVAQLSELLRKSRSQFDHWE
jgi:hypothetical protein